MQSTDDVTCCMAQSDESCRAPSRTYSYSGDSGAMVSIGLLRSIAFADLEECILKQWNSGRKYSPSPTCLNCLAPGSSPII